MIVANNVDEEHMGGTLGEDTDVKIPVVSVTKADGARLRAAARRRPRSCSTPTTTTVETPAT